MFINFFRNKGEIDIEPSSEELVGNKYRELSTPKKNFLYNYVSFTEHSNLKGNNYLKYCIYVRCIYLDVLHLRST